MKKADIADKVYGKLSCTKEEAFDLVELTLDCQTGYSQRRSREDKRIREFYRQLEGGP